MMKDLSTDEATKDLITDGSEKENGIVRNLYWLHFGGAGCSGFFSRYETLKETGGSSDQIQSGNRPLPRRP